MNVQRMRPVNSITSTRRCLHSLLVAIAVLAAGTHATKSHTVVTAFRSSSFVSRNTQPKSNYGFKAPSLVDATSFHQRTAGSSSSLSPSSRPHRNTRGTELSMFMGSDGGIFGVGAPEVFTILLVGYFVLGPSDLYKVVKEVGKAVQNFRNLSSEATASFENTFENQLQLQEIRKAQQELNDAFNFRRTINVDSESEAFGVNVQSERPGQKSTTATTKAGVAGAAAGTGAVKFVDDDDDGAQPADSDRGTVVIQKNGTEIAPMPAGAAAPPPPKKKFRRRVKKRKDPEPAEEFPLPTGATTTTTGPLENNVPDLEMEERSYAWESSEAEDKAMKSLEEARAELAKERDALMGQKKSDESKLVEQELASSGSSYDSTALGDSEYQAAAASRFQAQMSGTWNDSIVANTEKLQPLEEIMQRLALLEEEKTRADERLKEEFRLRQDNEEAYYREKRSLLEQAVGTMQQSVMAPAGSDIQKS